MTTDKKVELSHFNHRYGERALCGQEYNIGVISVGWWKTPKELDFYMRYLEQVPSTKVCPVCLERVDLARLADLEL